MFTLLVIGRTNDDVGHSVMQALTEQYPAHPSFAIDTTLAVLEATNGTPPLTVDLAKSADLVISPDRRLRAKVARLDPSRRAVQFTLIQAAELADRVHQQLLDGRTPIGAPPLPQEPAERLRWMVRELDAARGQLAGWAPGDLDLPALDAAKSNRKVADRVNTEATKLMRAIAYVITS